ncbi:Angiotensin-converting enzyme [Orchesella cincta]|uniref:Angiotensin-converting enzyme n=1 Tax=Orchesella cincta TaxID=48709 RepID=A0A1D2MIV0_ORCCI|nr:Angiotensin-converting enzyme [Orchesella cincta]
MQASFWVTRNSVADWDYETDLKNDTARNTSEQVSIEGAIFHKKVWNTVIKNVDYKSFKSEGLKRQLEKLSVIGLAALPEDKLMEHTKISSEMTDIYSTAKICPYKKQSCDLETEGLDLDPEIQELLFKSHDYDELVYAWTAWRNATGRKLRKMYNRYVDLGNDAAKLNDFDSLKGLWLRDYESPTFQKDCEELLSQVKPLYDELHAYTRYKLREKRYPEMKPEDPIPAHLFGNMWAQSWEHLNDLLAPFPDASMFDVSEELGKRYKPDLEGVTGMFETANEFFVSMGLINMSVAFGNKALIVKPKGKEVVCHASAWDFSKEDFRVKMCTKVNQEDFITIHHELGHIQYYMSYRNLPVTFREGANPGFHEAIGDVIALSVGSPKHMETIGLIHNEVGGTTAAAGISKESTINYLMQVGLQKIAFLPFAYLIDAYRWKMFDGSIDRSNLTYFWVKMRSEFQGVIPPVIRDEMDFDAGSKYHVPDDTPYIAYFVSHILQFQLYKALCITAKEYPAQPLHECDFYRNQDAGAQLKKLLEAGSSKNWQVLLEETIGQNKMDASAILEYFAPLHNYLKEYRAKMNYPIGWSKDAFEAMVLLCMKMTQIFNSAKICPFNNQSCDLEKDGLTLEPAIHLAYEKSQDLEERKYLWTAWRNATGRKLREPYIQCVDIIMESAKLDNYSITDRLLESYECPTFRKDIERLYSQVRPLYEEIHGYVRYKLGEKYPKLKLQPHDPIPAHLLGNIYAESWSDLSPFLSPFPNAPPFDITEQLKKKFTPDLKGITEMFDFANEFYISMGFLNMSSAYGPNAMIMKPTDREVDCHPQSKSMSKEDHRISMCTTINQVDFLTIFHELGHIQYYMSYRNQPYLFRNGANPGFHEAIGDVISLSAVTPRHLAKVGLVTENTGWSNESDLNYLMTMALEKIVVIPFSYLVDTYRWKVFDGEIDKRNLTYAWLKMRNELQGVVPPIVRDEKDFDPGAKYHVAQDMPFTPYFVSHILEFQLFKAFCETANEYPAQPLYQCDFYGNKEVGAQFRTLLEAGSSKQWQVLLNETIGESKLDAGPILEYFAPLYEYLKGYRVKMNYPIGWRNDVFEDFVRHGQEHLSYYPHSFLIITTLILGEQALLTVKGQTPLMCWECETADTTDAGYIHQCHNDNKGKSVMCTANDPNDNPMCYLQELRHKGTPVVAKVLRYCRAKNDATVKSGTCSSAQPFGPYESQECFCNDKGNCNEGAIAGVGGINWGSYPSNISTSEEGIFSGGKIHICFIAPELKKELSQQKCLGKTPNNLKTRSALPPFPNSF